MAAELIIVNNLVPIEWACYRVVPEMVPSQDGKRKVSSSIHYKTLDKVKKRASTSFFGLLRFALHT